jgi:hypothetical protein
VILYMRYNKTKYPPSILDTTKYPPSILTQQNILHQYWRH